MGGKALEQGLGGGAVAGRRICGVSAAIPWCSGELVVRWRGIGGNVGVGALLGHQSESALALEALALAVAARRPQDGSVHKQETCPALLGRWQWHNADDRLALLGREGDKVLWCATTLSGCLLIGSGGGRGQQSWQRRVCRGVVGVAASQDPHGALLGWPWQQQGCCDVGGAAVVGTDVGGGECAIALLGREGVGGRQARRCRGRSALASGLRGK